MNKSGSAGTVLLHDFPDVDTNGDFAEAFELRQSKRKKPVDSLEVLALIRLSFCRNWQRLRARTSKFHVRNRTLINMDAFRAAIRTGRLSLDPFMRFLAEMRIYTETYETPSFGLIALPLRSHNWAEEQTVCR